jgi:hypothetical protein
MSLKSIDNRLRALESRGPVIATFADYVRWHVNGCDPSVRWDPTFEMQMEELAKTIRQEA